MTDTHDHLFHDRTPGVEEREPTASYLSYTVGLALAIVATIASFIVSQTNLLWSPGIPIGLIVLAIAQIGVDLVFFLHLGSGPDSTNNILALAFGALTVFLIIIDSVWIIDNLNNNMMHTSFQQAQKAVIAICDSDYGSSRGPSWADALPQAGVLSGYR